MPAHGVVFTARRFRIVGTVQGVFFRAATRTEARRLGLTGWVRNLPDGDVEAYACGDPSAIECFSQWLEIGPAHARVTNVVTAQAKVEQLPDFAVR